MWTACWVIEHGREKRSRVLCRWQLSDARDREIWPSHATSSRYLLLHEKSRGWETAECYTINAELNTLEFLSRSNPFSTTTLACSPLFSIISPQSSTTTHPSDHPPHPFSKPSIVRTMNINFYYLLLIYCFWHLKITEQCLKIYLLNMLLTVYVRERQNVCVSQGKLGKRFWPSGTGFLWMFH